MKAPRPRLVLPLLLGSSGLLAACTASAVRVEPAPPAAAAAVAIEASWLIEPTWKERLPVHFVYIELRGDYRDFGAGMRTLLERVESAGIAASGPPFGLFFEDPSAVAREDLRAWACVPVEEAPKRLAEGLSEGDLPGGLVVYARVRGLGPRSSRSYPRLFDLARKFGWLPAAPVREIYLVDPATASSGPEWVTEIQVACSGA